MRNRFNANTFGLKAAFLIPFFIIGALLLIGSVVMLLWNGIMPEVFGLGIITFWQAIGLLILGRFLLGSWRSGGKRKSRHYAYCKVQSNRPEGV